MGNIQLPDVGEIIRTAKARGDQKTLAMLTHAIQTEIGKREAQRRLQEEELARQRTASLARQLEGVYGLDIPEEVYTRPEQLDAPQRLAELGERKIRTERAAKALASILTEANRRKMGEHATSVSPELLARIFETEMRQRIAAMQTQARAQTAGTGEYMPAWQLLLRQTAGQLSDQLTPPPVTTVVANGLPFSVDAETVQRLRKIDPNAQSEEFKAVVGEVARQYGDRVGEGVKAALGERLKAFAKPAYEALVERYRAGLRELERQTAEAQRAQPRPRLDDYLSAVRAAGAVLDTMLGASEPEQRTVEDHAAEFLRWLSTQDSLPPSR